MASRTRWPPRAAVAALLVGATATAGADAQTTHALMLRGHEQQLRLYGPPAGPPVIVSSGDGGWIHLGPHVAEWLAAHGFFVVGFDAKAYLESFTTDTGTLRPSDEPSDFRALAEFASASSGGRKPLLIGVSVGAGLSVLAAASPATKAMVAGVIALGLPERNELGWRWKDSLTYLTHRVPNEPTFSAAATVGAVAPVPLALIQSSRDEFVPLADTQQMLARAGEPKKLWIVTAANHRFSDNLPEFDQRLLEAIAWAQQHQPQ